MKKYLNKFNKIKHKKLIYLRIKRKKLQRTITVTCIIEKITQKWKIVKKKK